VSDALQLATPERVAVDLPVAGLGTRAMSYGLDVGMLWSVLLVVYFALSFWVPDPVGAVLELSSLVRTLSAAAVFAALWIYWTAMETLWNGQTPGKRLLRIRVVKADGSNVTLFTSAVRNLMRVIDFMPACYPVGLITMLVDKQHRRLGDIVAGTVLVREEQVDLSKYEQVKAELAVNELELATSYLARFSNFEAAAQLRVGRLLAGKLGLTVTESASATELRDAIRAKVEGTPR
jgi:uncharacterized RDD family membrane protein YckC